MNLNRWLHDNTRRLSSALIEKNRESIFNNEIRSLPARAQIIGVLTDLRSLVFAGICGGEPANEKTLEESLHEKVNHAATGLCAVLRRVLAHEYAQCQNTDGYAEAAEDIAIRILEGLPVIREILDTDIRAAYEGDPAAKSYEEILLSYPSIEAVSVYRIAHLFHGLGVPVLPRIMTEYAHTNTGIDIHPGAKIGNRFFIDHGTGVVIGETCTIGNNVKLYQGVTLGAKSFPLDEQGNPIKGIKRHPDIEDHVVIYSGATVLGDITIGHHCVIGGNVWLTKPVPPYSTVFNTQPEPVVKSM